MSNLPKVMQPGNSGAQPYFFIYVLFDILINSREKPARDASGSKFTTEWFCGNKLQFAWKSNILPSRKPASELHTGHSGR